MENNIQEVLKTKKIYGQSVVGDIVEPAGEESFPEDSISDEDLSNLREELKSDSPNTVKGTTTTDAINGVKNTHIDTDEFEKIVDIINEQDIRGKTITPSGIAMITDLLKEEPTDNELKHISEEFSKWFDHDHTDEMQITYLEKVLGERITEKIRSITSDDDYKSVIRRFTMQLYNTFQKVVQYNDDMRQLSQIAKKVSDYNNSSDSKYNSIEEFEKFNNEFKNLTDVQNDITEFMNKVSKLDDRNKRLKQDYSIDDYDIRTVESVKECLDKALSFELVKQKVMVGHKKMRKDFNDEKLVNSSIENWISDIRNDPDTLFTFPVNDFLSLKESRIKMEEFLYTAVLTYNLPKIIPDPKDDDLGEVMVKNNIITKEDNEKYKTQGRLLLYILSRTFKHKKLATDNDRRVLSYTLDIISKLGVHDHRERVAKLANEIYELIF